MNKTKYFIYVIDDFNELFKTNDNKNYYRYVFGPSEWYIANKLFYVKDYYEITEKEAQSFINKQFKLYEALWNTAYNLSLSKHKDQKDKAGKDYFLHPLYVSKQFEELDLKIVAIMHDLVEDTDLSLKNLSDLNFPKKIIKAMDSITKKKNETYNEYIKRLSKNNIAKQVKIKDLQHNLDTTRFKEPYKANESLLKRYNKALDYLLKTNS